MGKYDDIINLKRPVSKHPKMSLYQRAAQFAPYAALTGYEGQVKETARLTDRRIDIDDGLREILNNKLNYIVDKIHDNPLVSITYFVEDKKKDGGKYKTKEGTIKRIDVVNQEVIFTDKIKIYMKDILSISSDIFKNIEEDYEN